MIVCRIRKWEKGYKVFLAEKLRMPRYKLRLGIQIEKSMEFVKTYFGEVCRLAQEGLNVWPAILTVVWQKSEGEQRRGRGQSEFIKPAELQLQYSYLCLPLPI